MELKKCPRCGSFFDSELYVCQNCRTKENLDVEKVRVYIEENGLTESAEEMSIKTGV